MLTLTPYNLFDIYLIKLFSVLFDFCYHTLRSLIFLCIGDIIKKKKLKMIATETTEHTKGKYSVLSVYSGAALLLKSKKVVTLGADRIV